ncbi:reverse transcriptase domain-containing protein [Tanacetum coccineum]
MITSIDKNTPEVESKDLPPHLEYAFLEGDNKLPVIIAKDLSVGEKAALLWIFCPQVSSLPKKDSKAVICSDGFGAPREIISDRGTHFCNDQFTKVMLKYGQSTSLHRVIIHKLCGQVEVSNRGLNEILERAIGTVQLEWELMSSVMKLMRTLSIINEMDKRVNDFKIMNAIARMVLTPGLVDCYHDVPQPRLIWEY